MEQKIASILKQAPYFTKQNIALALGKEGALLDYWMKKLVREESLIPLRKGFYISHYYKDLISQNPKDSETYFLYLANVLRSPSYVSLEYMLSYYSLIPEVVYVLTSITPKSSRIYKTSVTTFLYRNIKQSLFSDYITKTFKGKEVRIASKSKALFDFLYLKPFATKAQMKQYLLEESRIAWDVLVSEDKDAFIGIVTRSQSKKMKTIVSILQKERIV